MFSLSRRGSTPLAQFRIYLYSFFFRFQDSILLNTRGPGGSGATLLPTPLTLKHEKLTFLIKVLTF